MQTKLPTLLIPFLLFVFSTLRAEKDPDRLIFQNYKTSINKKLPFNQLIVETGKLFLDKPYVGKTLEVNDKEELGVNFRELDCTTFLETSLALSLTAKSSIFSYDNFCNILTNIRYRRGVINGYPSRLHYFSDWITDNTQKGFVEDVTKSIGGDSIRFDVGFMSENPDKYRILRVYPEFIPIIANQEQAINKRLYYYIPKQRIDSCGSKIQSGDLIAITTSLKGLDISHVGIAIWVGNKLHLMHASSLSSLRKVVISEKTLSEYMMNVKSHTGIIVLRAIEKKTSMTKIRHHYAKQKRHLKHKKHNHKHKK